MRLRAFRLAVGFVFVLGCGLEESGLLPDGGEAIDGDALDATSSDVTTNDASPDASPSPDASSPDSSTPDGGSKDASFDVIALDVITIDASPPQILTITGGTYTLDAADSGACSASSGPSINFSLQNDRDASVDLIWVNYQCAEQLYASVLAGGNVNQQTYVNHVWRVRNTSDQAFLAEFSLTQQQTYAVTVH